MVAAVTEEAPTRIPLRHWLFAIPALLLVLVFIAAPYLTIAVMSVRTPSNTQIYAAGYTLQSYARIVGDRFYLGLLVDTLLYAAITAAICLVLAYPTALHLARTKSRMRGILYAAVLSPLLTGVVIRCFGWIVLLATQGVVNDALRAVGLGPVPFLYRPTGVIIALVHVFLPFMILPIMNAIEAIDPRLEEAARTLGAPPATVFRRITLPLSMPGVQSGVILVFVLAASAYVIPMLIGGGRVLTMATVIVQQLLGGFLWPFGAALALVLSLAVIVALIGFTLITRRTMRRLA
jgi:putative spermidine/putrescine transport system permease protein